MPKQLRLFMVLNERTKSPLKKGAEVLYFNRKVTAKTARNEAMAETGENFILSKGPDHRRNVNV